MRYFVTLFFAVGLLLSHPSQSETFTSKDWIWSTDSKDFYHASTINSADHILGQFCYFDSGSCLYIVSMETSCTEDNEYPTLINSNIGAIQLTLTCGHKFKEYNVMYINKFDEMDNLVKSATRLGIAIPMENDKFKVARFSLAGSTYAIELMRSAAELKINNQGGKNTKSEEYL